MNALIHELEKAQMHELTNHDQFRIGDMVQVTIRVVEGEKSRLQKFEGVVIRMRKGNNRTTFTVRKVSYGVGVERIFPLYAPTVQGIKIVSRSRVRRAKLYYLRNLFGKAAKLKEVR